MTNQEAEKMLEEFAAKLGEHFDAVQILGAWIHEDGSSRCAKRGYGLWQARQGMAHEFLAMSAQEDQACFIAEKLNPPDEGDNWKAAP